MTDREVVVEGTLVHCSGCGAPGRFAWVLGKWGLCGTCAARLDTPSESVSTPEKIDKILATLDRLVVLMDEKPGPELCGREIEGLGSCGLAPYHIAGCVTSDGRDESSRRSPSEQRGYAVEMQQEPVEKRPVQCVEYDSILADYVPSRRSCSVDGCSDAAAGAAYPHLCQKHYLLMT